MTDPLMTQIEYYQSEIERLIAERDDYRAKFERLGKAGEKYFVEQRHDIARLRTALWQIAYSTFPAAVSLDAMRSIAARALERIETDGER